MDRQHARQIIETLRAGVPSRVVSGVLMEGQIRLLEKVGEDLKAVERGASRTLIVRGQYGEGKTHLLSAVDNMARAQGFAISSIVVSKETPLNRINKVYEAVAHAVSASNLPRSGFEDVLLKLHPNSDVTADVVAFAQARLHPKLAYVFRNYLKEGDSLKRVQLYDDLAGASLNMADLRAIHRGNFHEAMKMPRRFLIQQDTFDYLRFLAFLLKRVGYKGWVILLDEVELLGKLGIGSRAQGYVNLAALLGLNDAREPLGSTYVILALATPFVPEVLSAGGRDDLSKVPDWLTDSRRNRESDAPQAIATMKSIVEDSIPLEPLSDHSIQIILERLEDCHNLAYDWSGRMDRSFVTAKSVAQVSNSTRTIIRAGLEYLDLLYQYGKPPEIDLRTPDVEGLDEDARFEGQELENNT